MRAWKVYKQFVLSSIARETEFRANFIFKFIQSGLWILFPWALVEVIFANTPQIAGWDRAESLALTATAMIVNTCINVFFWSLQEIPDQIRRGTLDFSITKPIDSQFIVSLRKMNVSFAGAFISSFLFRAYSLSQFQGQITVAAALSYTLIVLCSIIVYYGIMFSMMTLALYFVRVENLWVLADTAIEVARYPTDMYVPGVRSFLTFFLPIALFATIPTRVLLKGGGAEWILFSLVAAILVLVLTRLFWKRSLRRYTSASS